MTHDEQLLDDDRVLTAPEAGAPARAVLHHIRQLRDGAAVRDLAGIEQYLRAAIDALEPLPPDLAIDDPRARPARDAVDALRDALANTARDSDDYLARALDRAVFDPRHAWAAVVRACAAFAGQTSSRAPGATDAAGASRPPTFSIILFRRADDGGAIKRSFETEREQWMNGLAPRTHDGRDIHLAVVAPYDGADAIASLARALGVDRELPCVVFLGRDLPPAPASPETPARALWRRLCAYPLARRPGDRTYPDALARIYRTVYARGAIAGGSQLAAAFDRHLNAWLALRLVTELLAPWARKAVADRLPDAGP